MSTRSPGRALHGAPRALLRAGRQGCVLVLAALVLGHAAALPTHGHSVSPHVAPVTGSDVDRSDLGGKHSCPVRESAGRHSQTPQEESHDDSCPECRALAQLHASATPHAGDAVVSVPPVLSLLRAASCVPRASAGPGASGARSPPFLLV